MKWVIILILFSFIICGCNSHSEVKSIKSIKPKPDNRDRWRALAPFVKNHFNTDKTVEEIAADLSLAEYYLEIENEK